jgi:hypothetical protein
MATEDRQSEQFIREVDEELRRAQLKAIWDRFAPLIIGVCVLVVLLTAGYRGWLWWQQRQAAQAGDRFIAAVEKLDTDKAAAEAELEKIAEESRGGYRALARMRLAGEKAETGDKEAAIAGYDAVAADPGVSEAMRALARIRAGLLALDTGDFAGAVERAEPLVEPGNAWRNAAREILGLAAYREGDLQKARDLFTDIQQDAETPPELWVRSGMMVALIDGQLAAPGAEEGTAPAQTPAPAENQAAPAGEAGTTDSLPVPTEAPVMSPDASMETPAAENPASEAPASPGAPAATSETPAPPQTPAAPEAPAAAPATAPPVAPAPAEPPAPTDSAPALEPAAPISPQ